MNAFAKHIILSALSVSLLVPTASEAQQFPPIKLELIEGLTLYSPMQVLHAKEQNTGKNRLFIVQRGGTVEVLDMVDNNTFTNQTQFLFINVSTTGEGGLLSMAFHPDYANNRTFFLYYTNLAGDLEISRFQTSSENPYSFDPESREIILTIPHPNQSNHNGGEMHFGPDGMLYVTTGDGGGGGDVNDNAQNEEVFLGKILRLDVDGPTLFPSDNPSSDSPVYATGLRNPVRWSFDRETNDLWLGDVGQDRYEEINFVPFANLKGANFGWRCFEGTAPYNTTNCSNETEYTFPIHTYNIVPGGPRSVMGGVVYRGNDYPSMRGLYIGADHFGTRLHVIARDGDNFIVNTDMECPTGIIDFGESENGELYAVRLSGQLYRVVLSAPLPVRFVNFAVSPGENRAALLTWETSQFGAFKGYEIERSADGAHFEKIGFIDAILSENEPVAYTFTDHSLLTSSIRYYRIKALDQDGSFQYSSIVSYKPVINSLTTDSAQRYILSNPVRNGRLEFTASDDLNQLRLVSLSGQTVQNFDLSKSAGRNWIECGYVAPGLYIAVFSGPKKVVVEKVIFP